MASARTSSALELRKIRKKLRQIENLERLDRELTDEEYIKIEKKSKLRNDLLALLAIQTEDEEESSITVSTRSDVSSSQGGDNSASIATDDFSTSYSEQLDLSHVEVTVIEAENQGNNEQVDVETLDSEEGFVQVNYTANANEKNKTVTVATPTGEQSTCKREKAASKVNQAADTKTQSPAKKLKTTKSPTKENTKLQTAVHYWRSCRYDVIQLEGHSDLVTDVSADGQLLVTASRDTTIKLWDLDSMSQIRSYGGHTSTVTSVCILNEKDSSVICKCLEQDEDAKVIISGSLDCSFKIWSMDSGQVLQSTYTYNPITRLVYHSAAEAVITGSDGGKLEVWDIATKENIQSVSCFEGAFTSLLINENMVYCSSSEGLVKVFEMRERQLACMFVSENVQPKPGRKITARQIRGLTVQRETVYYGDDGTNIKVLNWRKGEVDKYMNHTDEFGITDCLCCHGDVIVSSAYSIDRGAGFLNVRYQPDGSYLSTLDDEDTERIVTMTCTTTANNNVVIVTGGLQLKVWVLTSPDNSSGDKLQSKFLTRLAGQAQDSDMESDTDFTDSEEESAEAGAGNRRGSTGSRTSNKGSWMSWCSVL